MGGAAVKHSPLPWTAETYSNRDCIHEMMKDANGKCIFDSANSDAMLIQTEHYGEQHGEAWDAQGRADFEFILKVIEERDELKLIAQDVLLWLNGNQSRLHDGLHRRLLAAVQDAPPQTESSSGAGTAGR